MRHIKRNFITVLAREAGVEGNSEDLATIYHITKELAGNHKPFDGPMYKTLRSFTFCGWCGKSRNMRIPSTPSNRSKIIFAINRPNKDGGLDGLLEEVSRAAKISNKDTGLECDS